MIRIIKHILISNFLLITYLCNLSGQDVSIEETVEYINEILLSSPSTVYMYEISISRSSGELYISREHKIGPPQTDKIHVNFNDLGQVYISRDMEMCNGSKVSNEGGKHILIWCKNKSECIYDPQSWEKYTCNVQLYLENSDYDYQRVLNAIRHLITEGKKLSSEIEQKKPYDPFSPKSQVQTTQNTSNNQSQNNSSSVDTYKTYRSSSYGFTLDYPTNFTPQSSTGKNVDFKVVYKGSSIVVVVKKLLPQEEKLTIEDVISIPESTWTNKYQLPDMKIIKKDVVYVDGKKGLLLHFTSKDMTNVYTLDQVNYQFLNNGYIYTITTTCEISNLSVLQSVFSRSVNSFKFPK